MDLAAVADDLYGLPPAEFTAARNARAKALAAKDKALADEIRPLPKPSAAAWAVNMLVRRRPGDITGILELGESLRDAQEALDPGEMKTLGQQRQALIAAVARAARELASELGNPIGESAVGEVEQTLQAAMADRGAAVAVQSGRLVRALASTGLEPADLSGAVAGPPLETDAPSARARASSPRPAAKATPPRPPSQRELARVRKSVDDAERRDETARTELQAIDTLLADLAAHRERLLDELDELQVRLTQVTRDLAAADRQTRSVGQDRDKASRALAEAERSLSRARGALAPEALGGGSSTLKG